MSTYAMPMHPTLLVSEPRGNAFTARVAGNVRAASTAVTGKYGAAMLARVTGLSYARCLRIWRGSPGTTLGDLETIARGLDVPVDELLGRTL
ncbi:helix-turn-helix domain-containing protein [Humibacter soli]